MGGEAPKMRPLNTKGKPVPLITSWKRDYSELVLRSSMFAKYAKTVPGSSTVRGNIALTPFKTTYVVSFYLGQRDGRDGLKNTSIFARFFR
jgi:hypothetical protein